MTTVRRRVELQEEDILWFEKTFPSGSLSGLMQILFSKYRESMDKTPEYYAELAVKSFMEETSEHDNEV